MPKKIAPPPKPLRLLLDQGFPKPKGFRMDELDRTVEAVHLSDFDPQLSENSTPDWYLYCKAAQAGMRALVTRDFSQAAQDTEMFTLSKLQNFSVVAWRKRMDDPIQEWGQLLAYLPELKKVLTRSGAPKVVFLPAPALTDKNYLDPKSTLGKSAQDRGISVTQVREEAQREIGNWMSTDDDPDQFEAIYAQRRRK